MKKVVQQSPSADDENYTPMAPTRGHQAPRARLKKAGQQSPSAATDKKNQPPRTQCK
jgi:hypothetical protein